MTTCQDVAVFAALLALRSKVAGRLQREDADAEQNTGITGWSELLATSNRSIRRRMEEEGEEATALNPRIISIIREAQVSFGAPGILALAGCEQRRTGLLYSVRMILRPRRCSSAHAQSAPLSATTGAYQYMVQVVDQYSGPLHLSLSIAPPAGILRTRLPSFQRRHDRSSASLGGEGSDARSARRPLLTMTDSPGRGNRVNEIHQMTTKRATTIHQVSHSIPYHTVP